MCSRIDADSGTVTVGPRAALDQTTLTASGVNWISVDAPTAAWLPVAAQIRHRHPAAPGRVRALEGKRAELVFDKPQSAITPGQAVVFYDGDVVVGRLDRRRPLGLPATLRSWQSCCYNPQQ